MRHRFAGFFFLYSIISYQQFQPFTSTPFLHLVALSSYQYSCAALVLQPVYPIHLYHKQAQLLRLYINTTSSLPITYLALSISQPSSSSNKNKDHYNRTSLLASFIYNPPIPTLPQHHTNQPTPHPHNGSFNLHLHIYIHSPTHALRPRRLQRPRRLLSRRRRQLPSHVQRRTPELRTRRLQSWRRRR